MRERVSRKVEDDERKGKNRKKDKSVVVVVCARFGSPSTFSFFFP